LAQQVLDRMCRKTHRNLLKSDLENPKEKKENPARA
jgi:hypothetical protein